MRTEPEVRALLDQLTRWGLRSNGKSQERPARRATAATVLRWVLGELQSPENLFRPRKRGGNRTRLELGEIVVGGIYRGMNGDCRRVREIRLRKKGDEVIWDLVTLGRENGCYRSTLQAKEGCSLLTGFAQWAHERLQ